MPRLVKWLLSLRPRHRKHVSDVPQGAGGAEGIHVRTLSREELGQWLQDHRARLEPRVRWLDRRQETDRARPDAPLSLEEWAARYRRAR